MYILPSYNLTTHLYILFHSLNSQMKKYVE